MRPLTQWAGYLNSYFSLNFFEILYFNLIFRYICNIMIGVLNGTQTKSMLLSTQILENTKNEAIIKALKKACNNVWPNETIFKNVFLILSDQAPTMLAVAENSKNIFPNATHITCVAHALHRVCEKIRDSNPKANKYISLMKKVLKKSPYRKKLFVDTCKIKLPINPIITRWGTWLEASFYYCENYSKILLFIEKLSEKKNKTIQKLKKLVEDRGLCSN